MMKNRSCKTEAVVLKRLNFGEADKLLTLFTRDYGKVKAIAKGIRKIKSRKASHLELFNVAEIFFVRGKTFNIITDACSVKTYSSLRKNLTKVAYFYKLAEIVEFINPEEQKDIKLYQFLLDGLALIDEASNKNLSGVTKKIINEMLICLGYLSKDDKTGKNGQDKFLEQIFERKLRTTSLLTKIRDVS